MTCCLSTFNSIYLHPLIQRHGISFCIASFLPGHQVLFQYSLETLILACGVAPLKPQCYQYQQYMRLCAARDPSWFPAKRNKVICHACYSTNTASSLSLMASCLRTTKLQTHFERARFWRSLCSPWARSPATVADQEIGFNGSVTWANTMWLLL